MELSVMLLYLIVVYGYHNTWNCLSVLLLYLIVVYGHDNTWNCLSCYCA